MNRKKFALIGHPVGHTMSPFIHSRLFALCGEDASYDVLDFPPEELSGSLPRLHDFSGFNVTIPHKQAIIPLLDSCDAKAEEFGSVNTVKNESGRLKGFTTDGEGFRLALEAGGGSLCGKVAVLGAGGAARAIAFELAHAGAEITIAARPHSAEAAARLCADLQQKIPGTKAGHCLISDLHGPLDLLVNATPAGMYPHADSCAAEEELIERSACVFDAVYNPGRTKLLALAEKHEKKTVGGIGMLVCQAAAAETIWFGVHFSAKSLAELSRETSFEMKKKFGNIILCGFMGCGKTTCGRLLAQKTGRQFLDLDEYIEQKAGMPVARIFAKQGEPAFRSMERQAVQKLSLSGGMVIAAGGGTLLQKENAEDFRANGVVVFLDASLEAVRERLREDTARPLLHPADGIDRTAELYENRRPLYRAAADLVLSADGSPEQNTAALVEAVKPAVK